MTKRQIDWEKIELDYRAGIKTLRQIADEHGILNPRKIISLSLPQYHLLDIYVNKINHLTIYLQKSII